MIVRHLDVKGVTLQPPEADAPPSRNRPPACGGCRSRLGQHVQHLVRQLWRCEDLVVGEVGDARQHIRVAAAQGEARLGGHGMSPSFLTANGLE